MSMKYECWAYVNGKPEKMVFCTTNSKSDAEAEARQKFDSMGVRYDYVKCK